MGRLSQIAARTDLGFCGVTLYDPKNSFNVGGALRATGAFKGGYFCVQGKRWELKGNPWRHMDTEGAHARLPVYLGVEDYSKYVPYGAEVVCVELSDDAIPLHNFKHPKVATYVFGPEDGAIPVAIPGKRVYIPTEYSLNLYSAVTAVLYDRVAKAIRMNEGPKCPACNGTHYHRMEEIFHCNSCGVEWRPNENVATAGAAFGGV